MKKSKLVVTCMVLLILFAMIQMQINPVYANPSATVTFYSTTSDAYIYRTSPIYSNAHEAVDGTLENAQEYIVSGQFYVSSYRIFRGWLFFDTSSLPDDCVITSAFLSLKPTTTFKVDDGSQRGFVNITIQNGQPTYPHEPVVAADYNRDYYSGNGGTLNASAWDTVTYHNITLNDDGKSWINKTGTTKLTLRTNREIAQTVPTNTEDLDFYCGRAVEANKPKLIITYVFAIYTLDMNSLPTSISFTLNGSAKTTPYSDLIENGTYQINFTDSFVRDGLTWSFAHWNDNTSNTDPDRTINLQSNSTYSVTYTSEYSPITYTGFEPVFECAMNNMFELNGILEGNDTYRQMLFDSSPYENHGKIYPLTHPYAGPTLTWGFMGKALEFDGVDDSVIVSYDDSLNVSEAITIEFWFNPYNSTPNQVLLSKATTSSSGEWYIGIVNNQIYVKLWTQSGNAFTGTITDYNLTDGIFVYVGLTYDYRDGYYTILLHGTPWLNVTTDGNKVQVLDKNLYLGNLGNSSNWFNGIFDEIRIFPYKRTEGEIYTDARSAIVYFGETALVNSGESDDGSAWTVVEGTSNGYQGFTGNDPHLPWAYANNTNPYTFVRTLKYLAGFQSYQLYCNVKFDCNEASDTSPLPNNYVIWYWNFFKDGILQVSYYVSISPIFWEAVGEVPQWSVRFRRSTPYEGDTQLLYYEFNVNETAFPKSIPIIVSAWIGPDNSHFTVRVDFQDVRVFESSLSGGNPPFIYSFDLVDKNLNKHITDWFDGWIVSGIKIDAHRITSGKYARMEIESHKLGLLAFIIILSVVTVAGWLGYQWITTGKNPVTIITETFREVVNILTHVPEIIGTAVKAIGNAVVDALSGLAHDIIGGLSVLGGVFTQALSPISNLLIGLGTYIVNAFISFMNPLLTAIWNGVQSLWSLIVQGMDSLLGFSGNPHLFSDILSFLGTLTTNIGNAFTFIGTLLTQGFIALATVFSNFATVLTSFVGTFVNMWNYANNIVGGAYGVGLDFWNTFGSAFSSILVIIAIVYVLWLVTLAERQGFGAVIDHIKGILDIGAFVVGTLLHMAQVFIQFVTALVEALPF